VARILTRFELRQPGIRFFKRQVQSVGLIVIPCTHRILLERLALHVLRDCFAHDPVGRTVPLICKAMYASFQVVIELDGRGHDGMYIRR
jgi:hypothetical protein